MAECSVECETTISASPDAVWRYVGDFWSDWHPAIAKNRKVLLETGAEARAFVGTDGKSYQEQLSYFSVSDRRFQYSTLR